jgi:phosphoesterase RecJ-like protein
MNESVHQQIIPLIERSERILLCTHRKPDGDAVGSIMALTKALNLLGKEVTAACADEVPDNFHFLPDINMLHKSVAGGKDFVVTLDCDKTEVDRLKYHLEDNKIHIVITPKNGQFVKENVSCHEGTGNYDLIITVDVADIPQLGKLYEDNSELFASVPVVNIDHHISNTQFGKINHIDVSASSTAEMLHALIRDMEKQFGKTLITPDVATFLLSGVTTDTGSFQNANTTPKSMEVAADLMEAGANQHDVIKYLFRTKKLSTLKLWGKILTKIEVDPKHRLVWSSITQQDLKQSGAHIDESGDIIDDLLVHAPEAEMIALFKEDEEMISVSFRSTNAQANVMEIAKTFGGGGHVQAAGVKFSGKTLPEVMNQVVAAMQAAQQARLGLEGIQEVPVAQQDGEVTQVLDGYTPGPASVQPTLEERVSQEPLAPSGEVPVAPAEAPQGGKVQMVSKVQGPSSNEGTEANSQGPRANVPNNQQSITTNQPPAPQNAPQAPTGDLHHQTKAAIQAEQSQASNETITPPSQGAAAQRPAKPQVEQRFNEKVPDYLKGEGNKVQGPSSNEGTKANNQGPRANEGTEANSQGPRANENTDSQQIVPNNQQSTMNGAAAAGQVNPGQQLTTNNQQSTPPPAPQAQTQTTDQGLPTNDDGVSVSYGNSPSPAPVIPENSVEPVVKTVNPAPAPPTAAPAAPPQASSIQPPAINNNQPTTPASPPTPPKDPFATGNDGLTDIERALGGL